MASTSSLLLVEDDSDLRDIFQRRLERRGFTVTAVEDPQTAIEAMAQRQFDVAVVDRMLPSPGGIALMEELRHLDAALRIVVMSGLPAERWVADAEKRGASVCLTKPFALAELDAAVLPAQQVGEPA